jgi:hypothetical protein
VSRRENKRRKEGQTIYIEKTIETPEGGVKFQGELTQEEVDLVLSCGLNWLMQQGALPLVIKKEEGEQLQ